MILLYLYSIFILVFAKAIERSHRDTFKISLGEAMALFNSDIYKILWCGRGFLVGGKSRCVNGPSLL